MLRTESPVIAELLRHNGEQSSDFCSPDHSMWRQQYNARHPTKIIALECMDGRVNLPLMTNTPPGIIKEYRNVGGKFDIGYPLFGKLLQEQVNCAMRDGRNVVFLVTYHWSRGNKDRGCKGFRFDVEAAKSYAASMKRELEEAFGTNHLVVYPVLTGIETDEDALVIHGEDGQALDMGSEAERENFEIGATLGAMLPGLSTSMRNDLFALIAGNRRHVLETRASGRPVSHLDHKERVLMVGRGFDWHHRANEAVIVGPYGFNLEEPIAVAANILLHNIEDGRINPEDGVVLMSSAPYEKDKGPEPVMAAKESRSIMRHALEVIEASVPRLLEHLAILPGTVHTPRRSFTRIDFE